MSPDFIFYTGVVICGIVTLFAMIAAIILCMTKRRINRKIYDEYGKRRH